MTHKEYLEAARALITDEKNWNTQVYASNERNEDLNWYDPRATKFCALGAINRSTGAMNTPTHYILYKALGELYPDCCDKGIVYLNDMLGHKAVMAVYDRAIKLSEQ